MTPEKVNVENSEKISNNFQFFFKTAYPYVVTWLYLPLGHFLKTLKGVKWHLFDVSFYMPWGCNFCNNPVGGGARDYSSTLYRTWEYFVLCRGFRLCSGGALLSLPPPPHPSVKVLPYLLPPSTKEMKFHNHNYDKKKNPSYSLNWVLCLMSKN